MTAHQNNFIDRARDAHSLKFKSGLSPLQHFYYFLASPFSGISLFSFQIILHTFAAFFIDTYGMDAYKRLYSLDPPEKVLDKDWATLEAEWHAWLEQFADQEVGYLLHHIEGYDGVSIMAVHAATAIQPDVQHRFSAVIRA